ncbi:MAG TPA: hypothetical protein VF570_07260, partial [Pyrinomonadaceae bacterium]
VCRRSAAFACSLTLWRAGVPALPAKEVGPLKRLKFSSTALKLLKTKALKISFPPPKKFPRAQVSLNGS